MDARRAYTRMQVEHPPEDASRWPQLAVLRSDRAVSPCAVGGHVAVAVVQGRDGRVRDGRVLVHLIQCFVIFPA